MRLGVGVGLGREGWPRPSGLVLPYSTGMLLEYEFALPYAQLDGDGLITSVLDKSGAGRNSQVQSDPARRFKFTAASAIGGRPAAEHLPSTLSYLQSATGLALLQSHTVYCVAAALGVLTSTILFDGSAAGSRALIWFPSGTQMLGATGGGISSVYLPPSTGGLFVGLFDGASSELRADGVSKGTGTTGTAAIDFFAIGARFSFGSNFNGSIAYFAVQSGHPAPADLAANELALRQWFSLP